MSQQGFGIPTPNEDSEGTVNVAGSVEVANDEGNPLPVSGTATANQGAAGATPWPVDIQGGTVSVSNLQQLSVQTVLSVVSHDLDAASYSGSVPFAQDSLLGALDLRFTSVAPRNVTILHSDGTTIWSVTNDVSLRVAIDFEDLPIDAGSIVTVTVSTTTAPCLMDVTMTAKIGTSALGGNPVLGAGENHVGSISIDVTDSPSADAFSRLRVSHPVALFDTQHQYGISSEWGTIVANGGTVAHDPPMSAVLLQTTATTGSRVAFQTRRYVRYQPGISTLMLASVHIDVAVANLLRRVGYYDDANGIFLEQNGTVDVAVALRSSVSGSPADTRVVQSAWNIDPLDGTGPSGLVLDLTKVQLLVIDLQWLAVGRVRVGFDIGGGIVYVHQFLHANVIATPYMSTANLPVRYEQENLGGAVAAEMHAICCVVMAEGGFKPFGVVRAVDTGTGPESVTAREPILAIRPKATFNGLVNRGQIAPIGFDLLASSDVRWEIVYRPTLTGAVFASVGTGSIAEVDTSATAVTGGTVVASGYKATGSGTIVADLDLERQGLFIEPDGTVLDMLVLVVTSLSGSANCYASFRWREDW